MDHFDIESQNSSNSKVLDGFSETMIILFRWKSSIYKLIWKEVLIYIGVYIALSVLYDYVLSDTAKKDFTAIAQYCLKYTSSIPVIFLLGFFTSTAMQRWFTVQTNIPGTARAITIFSLSLKADAENGSLIVHRYSRWILLSWALTFRSVSKPMRKKYPDLISLEKAGVLVSHERFLLEKEEADGNGSILPLFVIDWLLQLLKQINSQSNFINNSDFSKNVDIVLSLKKSCGNTIKFASNNIPFALIQAVTISVYAFGIASLMARQVVDERNTVTAILTGYIPIFNSIQYFLFFAWLKFGHAATDPFGDDENDIDVSRLFQCHLADATRLSSLYNKKLDEVVFDPILQIKKIEG